MALGGGAAPGIRVASGREVRAPLSLAARAADARQTERVPAGPADPRARGRGAAARAAGAGGARLAAPRPAPAGGGGGAPCVEVDDERHAVECEPRPQPV